ncbi:hypothetical protein [Hydrogenovibrio sp. JE_KL2]|uniref:hypothetical protein n=1 Tax=Hydrogenovibrio sp. JE_KL2 TaxID=2651188 RepID=UPI00128BEBD6|nr:hypothetical protein [Hydrogenovibrio sp. JE_KL2]MPQ76861.1 hypothetical protein [Hydrogenovibrio sp. JE_KL2]
MKKLFVGAAIITTLSLGACSSMPSKSMSYDDVVAQATAQHDKAKKMGNVWKQKKMKLPYVDTYLAKAAEAKKKGDAAKAMELAQEALKTANAEVNQMEKYADLQPAWIPNK